MQSSKNNKIYANKRHNISHTSTMLVLHQITSQGREIKVLIMNNEQSSNHDLLLVARMKTTHQKCCWLSCSKSNPWPFIAVKTSSVLSCSCVRSCLQQRGQIIRRIYMYFASMTAASIDMLSFPFLILSPLSAR